MDKTKRGRGRPPKTAADKRSEAILVSLTPAERELIKAAAGDEPLAVWARDVMLRAARR